MKILSIAAALGVLLAPATYADITLKAHSPYPVIANNNEVAPLLTSVKEIQADIEKLPAKKMGVALWPDWKAGLSKATANLNSDLLKLNALVNKIAKSPASVADVEEAQGIMQRANAAANTAAFTADRWKTGIPAKAQKVLRGLSSIAKEIVVFYTTK